jgi:hypothetical protein
MILDSDSIHAALRRHIQSFFEGHAYDEAVWTLGPAPDVLPRLKIACLAPGPKIGSWVYITIGAWEAGREQHPLLEFMIIAPEKDLKHVELLAMTAYYHHTYRLGLFHTFPIGEAWLPGSTCTCFLVSLPYPFGETLRICDLPTGSLRLLWLLPITKEEKEFAAEHGVDALEQRFDECAIEYWNPRRASVI